MKYYYLEFEKCQLADARSLFLTSVTLFLSEHGLPVVLHRDNDPALVMSLVESFVELADVALSVE